jgi:hypothetical protein
VDIPGAAGPAKYREASNWQKRNLDRTVQYLDVERVAAADSLRCAALAAEPQAVRRNLMSGDGVSLHQRTLA